MAWERDSDCECSAGNLWQSFISCIFLTYKNKRKGILRRSWNLIAGLKNVLAEDFRLGYNSVLEKRAPYKLKIKCEISVSIAVCTNQQNLNYSPSRHLVDFIFLLTDPLYPFEVASRDSGLPLWGNMHNEYVHIQLPPFLAYLQDTCTILSSRSYQCKSWII